MYECVFVNVHTHELQSTKKATVHRPEAQLSYDFKRSEEPNEWSI